VSAIESFIQAVPKAELHLHLVGSASPTVVSELASRRPEFGVPTSVDELSRLFTFTDFAHFIEIYARVASLVCSGDDIATLIEGSARDLAVQNVRYVEMTITPFTHLQSGISYDEVLAGLDTGRLAAKALGVEFAWVFDTPGEMGQHAAQVTIDLATNQPPAGLIGFGLSGIEAGVDRASFQWAFDRARAAGLRSVPHAGEGDGPASIIGALDALRADRIGHGVRAVEDPNLLRRIVDLQVPLEVCPSSNVCTGVYATLADHPLPTLLAAGAFVTINTDDPPMFSTTLNDEYRRIADTFNLGIDDIAQLVTNGVEASFMDQRSKSELIQEIAAVANEHRP
jgi:aminodeoxyfutalosine deaminase